MGRYIYMFNSGLILLKKIISDCYLHDLRKIIIFFKYFIAIWLIYNVGLILGVQQNKSVSYICIYIYPPFLKFLAIIECWVTFTGLYSRSLLVIHFIYNGVFMSVPVFQFTPSLLYPFISKSFFSTSITLFLCCR